MSWAKWFCPPEGEVQSPALIRRRDEYEQRARLASEGFVACLGEYWKIDEERLEGKKWEELLRTASKASVRYLEVIFPLPAFFRQVAHVEFLQLRSLYLRDNRIESVEAIVHLNAPQLANLDLRRNRISQMKSLRKVGWRYDHLFLAGNPIIDYSPLPEVQFHRRLQTTFVTNFSGEDYADIADLSPFFKTQPLHVLGHLFIRNIRTLDTARRTALLEK